MNRVELIPVQDLPLVRPGDDLAQLMVDALQTMGEALHEDDVVVVAQKVVSKAEGRLVRLADVQPDAEAEEMARRTGKDPRMVHLVLTESREVIRARKGLLVVEQRNGWICANAGVDRSNVNGDDLVALLPLDADASAAALRDRLAALTGVAPAVIINDSHGRPWRVGTVGISIGSAGLPPVWDQRGLTDLYGYELVGSEECIADELAAAASLVMGQSDEGRPVVVVRGYDLPDAPPQPAVTIQRAPEMDVFR